MWFYKRKAQIKEIGIPEDIVPIIQVTRVIDPSNISTKNSSRIIFSKTESPQELSHDYKSPEE